VARPDAKLEDVMMVCQVALTGMSEATCDRIAKKYGGKFSAPQPDSLIYVFPNRKSILAFNDYCGNGLYVFNLRRKS
jgi:hypothetical protein